MRSKKLSEIRNRVIESLEKLAEDLGAEIYLFGSYASQTHTLHSDVDILVVSNKFEGLPFYKRVEIVRTKLPRDIGFDIIALTPRELESRKERAFYREISQYWIKIRKNKYSSE